MCCATVGSRAAAVRLTRGSHVIILSVRLSAVPRFRPQTIPTLPIFTGGCILLVVKFIFVECDF